MAALQAPLTGFFLRIRRLMHAQEEEGRGGERERERKGEREREENEDGEVRDPVVT